MFNVMLVDDEELVIKGLCDFVNWESLGYCITATANSVDEAVSKLDENQIDVILTDVKMPEKTGIDLLEIVRDEYDHIELIILSGYGEFEYAQKAMRLGALGYLTKPVNFEELKTIFRETHSLLMDKRKEISMNSAYRNQIKNRYLGNLLKGLISEFHQEEAEKLAISIEDGNASVLRIKLNSSIKDWDSYNEKKASITRIIHGTMAKQHKYQVVDCEVKELAVIVMEPIDSVLNIPIAESLITEIQERQDETVTIGIGNVVNTLSQLNLSYAQAGKAIQYSIIKRTDIVSFDVIDDNLYYEELFDERLRAQLLRFLSLSMEKELIDRIEKVYEKMIDNDMSRNAVFAFSIELITFIGEYLVNFNESEYLNKKVNAGIKTLVLQNSTDKIKENVAATVQSLIEEFKPREEVPNDIVSIVKQYINDHYSEDLRLNTVADLLFIHPIYLSRLFKDKSGENYLEYVTRVRIEKAKLLLKDLSMKIYHVSDSVGYESPRYFSKIFKSATGMTPKEYRERTVKLL